jgi:hypothetical protein
VKEKQAEAVRPVTDQTGDDRVSKDRRRRGRYRKRGKLDGSELLGGRGRRVLWVCICVCVWRCVSTRRMWRVSRDEIVIERMLIWW